MSSTGPSAGEGTSYSAGLPSASQSNSTTASKNASFASKSSDRKPSKTNATYKMMTLASMLKYIEGYEIIVELKTGKRHQGILVQADDNMNLILKIQDCGEGDVKLASSTDQHDVSLIWQHSQKEADPSNLSIRGSQIRYIQFPDNANLSSIVLGGREREQAARHKYRKTLRKSTRS
jgi:small nuclear ribonucleoprotein (snRNP)-like protein